MAAATTTIRRVLDFTETPPSSPGVARITAGIERIVLDRDRRLIQAQAELTAATQATLDAEAAYQNTPRFNEAARSAAFALVNANSKRVRELSAEIERLRAPVPTTPVTAVTPVVPRTPVRTPIRAEPPTPVVIPRTPVVAQPVAPRTPIVIEPSRPLPVQDNGALRARIAGLKDDYNTMLADLRSVRGINFVANGKLIQEENRLRDELSAAAGMSLPDQLQMYLRRVQRLDADTAEATEHARRIVSENNSDIRVSLPNAEDVIQEAVAAARRIAARADATPETPPNDLLLWSHTANQLDNVLNVQQVAGLEEIERLEQQLTDLNNELVNRFSSDPRLLDFAPREAARQVNQQREYRQAANARLNSGRSLLPPVVVRIRFLQEQLDRTRALYNELVASTPPPPRVVLPPPPAPLAVEPEVQPVVHALEAENEAGEARGDVQADNIVALREHVQQNNAAEQVNEENRARGAGVVGGLLQYARDTVGGLLRRGDGVRGAAAVDQAVAAIDNANQALADQNADDRAAADRRAAAEAALEAQQRANEENLDLVILVPMEARFPRLGAGGDDVGDDPSTFIARTFTNGADFVEWRAGANNGEPGQLRLRNIRSQTIAWVFEKLFGPIFDEWWRTDTHHTYHWMNTIIPFTTAMALAFRSAVAKAEENDIGVPETLSRAYEKFTDMVLFALMKALTGIEAEIEGRGIPNKQEKEPAPRQPSEFEVDENYTNNPTVVAWLRDATTQNQLRVGVPVVEMIFGIQDSMERRGLSLDYAGNFSRLFEVTTDDDSDRLKMQHVRFAELVTDQPPRAGEIASASLQSFESRLSRIMGLPVLDVLYADDAAAIGVSPENFMFQDVRGLIDETLFAQLGTLPSFFRADPPQRGLQAVSRDGQNELELISGLLREAAAAEAAASATGQSRRGGRRARRGRTSELPAPASNEELLASFRSARGRDSINRLYDAVSRRPTNVEELEIFERLAFPALLNQLANIRGLWDASLAGTGDLRRPLAFKLLAAALFQNVALNADDVAAFEAEADKSALDYSFFGRIALRPKYNVFVQNPESDMPNIEPRYLETAARAGRGGRGGQRRRRRSHSMGAKMVRADGTMVESNASLSSLFERPRLTLQKLSKSIAKNQTIGNQVYEYLALLREFDGELADELDSEIEPMRTVLVPTDRAIGEFVRSNEFQVATRGAPADERDRYLIDVLRYHVLARQIDFERLLRDRAPASLVPTELEIDLAGGERRTLRMEIEVVNYNNKTGGTLRINAGRDDGREFLYVIGAKQRARNGDYYTINRIVDPERAKELNLEGRSLRATDAARPRVSRREEQTRAGEEFEAEAVFRDFDTDDEEEEEQRRVRFAQTEPERLRTPPSLVRSSTNGGLVPGTREHAIEVWLEERARRRGWVGPNNPRRVRAWLERARADVMDWRRVAREEPERRAEMEEYIRGLEPWIERNVRRLEREENEEMARNADRIDAERMSTEQLLRSRASAKTTTTTAATAALTAASQQRATKTLAKAQENNEKDFEPMKRMLEVSGVRQEIIDARCAGKNVYVLAPTREALRRAGIDVDQMSDEQVRDLRDFVRSHVLRADWESETSPGRRMRGPMMPQDFIWMLQQRNRTPVRTFALESSGANAASTIHYVPLHERTKPTAPEHEHAQLHIDDLQLDRPQHTYAADKDLYVYFLNRTLVAPKGVPQQQQKASGAAAVAVPQPTPTAAGGAKTDWNGLATSVERALKTNTNQTAYHDDVLRFGRAIDELGGPKKIVSIVPVADVDRTFDRLHNAISRNQHIGTEQKTKAHDALDQMFARF